METENFKDIPHLHSHRPPFPAGSMTPQKAHFLTNLIDPSGSQCKHRVQAKAKLKAEISACHAFCPVIRSLDNFGHPLARSSYLRSVIEKRILCGEELEIVINGNCHQYGVCFPVGRIVKEQIKPSISGQTVMLA
uniref:Uncharacterized protein n=1 Tax=Loa loa TaxID=7209 RepID=A0A1I7VQ54_LOALO